MASDSQFTAAPAMATAMDPQLPPLDDAVQGRQAGVTVRAGCTVSHLTTPHAGTHSSGLPKPIPKVNNPTEDREESTTPNSPTSSKVDGLLSTDAMRRHQHSTSPRA